MEGDEGDEGYTHNVERRKREERRIIEGWVRGRKLDNP